MIRKFKYTGSVVTTVSVNNPEEDWVLFPQKVYEFDTFHPIIQLWIRRGLLKEVK